MRKRITNGMKLGLATEAALLAHGRGEAFDYLLGEKTHSFALDAIQTASALILCAKHPVLSVNGSSASLAGLEIAELVNIYDPLTVEVNLFYHSDERSQRIAQHLRELGVSHVVESCSESSLELTDIQHARRRMHPEGIAQADVVLVALEDGDRCQSLVDAGKTVIVIDLNPMSRSAQTGYVTIVDELTRVLNCLALQIKIDKNEEQITLQKRISEYDNGKILTSAINSIRNGT
jgi:4-phosphopantoate--beta-alanine ligase